VQRKENRFFGCRDSFNDLDVHVSRQTVEAGCKLIGVNRPDEKKHEHGFAEGITSFGESIKLSRLRKAREKYFTDMITTLLGSSV
jgi:hypothetical protein